MGLSLLNSSNLEQLAFKGLTLRHRLSGDASMGVVRDLRSVTTSDLVIPRVRLATFGSRTFSVAGPVCWNGLPDYLKSPDL